MANILRYARNIFLAGTIGLMGACLHLSPEQIKNQYVDPKVGFCLGKNKVEESLQKKDCPPKKSLESIVVKHNYDKSAAGIKNTEEKKSKEPSNAALVGAGLGMGLADYFLGVGLHERSHILIAAVYGAEIKRFSIWPEINNGSVQFGYSAWVDTLSKRQEALALFMPKIVDMGIIGTYIGLLEANSLPKDKFVQLSLAVLATGALVDFVKDIASANPENDIIRFYKYAGCKKDSEVGIRVAQGILAAGTAIELIRGYYQIFSKGENKKDRSEEERKKVKLDPIVGLSYLGVGGSF